MGAGGSDHALHEGSVSFHGAFLDDGGFDLLRRYARATDLEHVIRRKEHQPEGIVRLIMSYSDRQGCLDGARGEVPESVIQPGFQFLEVLHHDLLRLWFRVHVLRINLIPL